MTNRIDESESVIVPNPVVDNTTKLVGDESELVNPAFVPQDKLELFQAIERLLQPIADEDVPSVYDSLKKAIEGITKEEGETMSNLDFVTPNVMETVRLAVRKIISEDKSEDASSHDVEAMQSSSDVSLPYPKRTAWVDPADEIADDDEESDERDYRMTDDVEGMTFDEIAAETGFASARGAMAVVDRALNKMKFLMSLDEDQRAFIVLSAMDDYINFLRRDDEVTDEDEELMRQHPAIVEELPGFRDHLHKFIRRGMKELGFEGDSEDDS